MKIKKRILDKVNFCDKVKYRALINMNAVF